MWEPLLGFYSHRVMLRSEHRSSESTAGWAAAQNTTSTAALATASEPSIFNTITTDKPVQNARKMVVKASTKDTWLQGHQNTVMLMILLIYYDTSIQ